MKPKRNRFRYEVTVEDLGRTDEHGDERLGADQVESLVNDMFANAEFPFDRLDLEFVRNLDEPVVKAAGIDPDHSERDIEFERVL